MGPPMQRQMLEPSKPFMGSINVYDALADWKFNERMEQLNIMKNRRRLNCVPALLALFLPWLLYLLVFWVASFQLHYETPVGNALINLTCLISSIWYMRRIWNAWRNQERETFYRAYMAVACFCAVCIGWAVGDYNFWMHMQPYYNVNHLATYTNVDPSSQLLRSGAVVPTRGKRYQDVGKVYFNHETILDMSKAMSFKMGDLYCVVPIVNPSCKKNCGYDFWAVGINCCSEDGSKFECGEYKNTVAKSGLRMMIDHDRAFYRMAVLEAETTYKVVSTHPLFFQWLHDPLASLAKQERSGYRWYVVGMIVFFFGNAVALYLCLKLLRKSVHLHS